MFNYAQINEQGYCIGVASLTGEIISDDVILLTEYDNSYINRKYDKVAKRWTDEYFIFEPEPSNMGRHEELTETINETTQVSSTDNIINMDMLLALDEKLNLVIEHLGLTL